MRSVGSLARSVGATGAGVAILLAGSPAFAGASDPQEFTQIERGRYLAVASDCASCHTLPGSNTPFAGGRAIETPFGNIIAPNITPDRETGIGAWSDAEFDAAVRKGVRRDGSPLYPAMPYNAYTKMSSDDVQAIHAYLSTVTPVRNPVVAQYRCRFHSTSARRCMCGMRSTSPRASTSRTRSKPPNGTAAPSWSTDRHTVVRVIRQRRPWAVTRTTVTSRAQELQGWFAPNITNDARVGLGGWSVDDLVAYLKTGHNRVTAATGPMAEEVSLSSSHMTDPDLKAIAAYLKTVPGGEGTLAAVARR